MKRAGIAVLPRKVGDMHGKILLIGDLRPGMNFGAIATSECMLRLVRNEVGNGGLRSIDIRSFKGHTPECGYRDFEIPRVKFCAPESDGKKSVPIKLRFKRDLKALVFKFGLQNIFERWNQIPNSWSEFQIAGKRFQMQGWLPYERRLLSWADCIVINAEGSIVHNIHNRGGRYRLGARYMLFMAYLAKVVYGKPTAVINHIIDPDDEDFKDVIRNLYPTLDYIAVRDEVSVQNLNKLGISNAEFVPDALFSHEITEGFIAPYDGWPYMKREKPIVLVGDSASIPYVAWDLREFYADLFTRLDAEGYKVVFVDGASLASNDFEKLCREKAVPRITVYNTSWEELGAVMAEAAVFFSGRWHASILGTIAGCPSVLFGTDSHKTRALHEMVGCRTPFFDVERLPDLMNEIVGSVKTEIQAGPKRREELKEIAAMLREKTNRYREIIRALGSRSPDVK